MELLESGELLTEGKVVEMALRAKAKYYLRSFGLTCIFESTSNDDLKYVWGTKSDMPSELYPLLVELAEKEVAEMQKKLNVGYEEDNDFKELKTPEEREQYILNQKYMMEMTPKQFWMMLNGIKNETVYDCPLYNRSIEDTECYEVQAVRGASLRMDALLTEERFNLNEADKHCDQCLFNQLPKQNVKTDKIK